VRALEARVIPYLLALKFDLDGVVNLPASYDFQIFLTSANAIESIEAGIQDYITRWSGDISVFPVMLRAHGFRGSDLRKYETEFINSTLEIEQIFAEIGFAVCLCYGTLLGIVREGSFIAHDDDVDLAYEAKCENLDGLRDELVGIVSQLKNRGVNARIAEGYLFLKVKAPKNKKFVDIFPVVRSGESSVAMYMNKMTIRDVPRESILPFGDIEFFGHKTRAPAKPEIFLEDRYGASWRVPDRFYGLDWVK
jgi:LicD family